MKFLFSCDSKSYVKDILLVYQYLESMDKGTYSITVRYDGMDFILNDDIDAMLFYLAFSNSILK